MPVDVSPYATLGQGGGAGSLNLLGMLGQGAQLQNMLNQNAQFQQEFAAKKALGEVLAGAVDPETKRVDWKKAIVEGSKRPDLAWKMPELANQVAQREQMDAQTLKLALENEKEKMAAVSAVALTVAKQYGDNVKPENLVGPMADLHSRGFFSGPESVAALSQLSGKNGPELKQALLTIAGYGQRSADLLNGVAGTHGEYTDPTTGEKKQGWGSPLFGQITPTQVLPQQTQAPAAGRSAQQGAPAVSSMSPYRTEALKEIATKYEPDLNKRADSAVQLQQVLAESRELLRNYTPGRGATMRQELARWLTSLGASEETVRKVNGGDVSSSQAFEKLAVQAATAWMKQTFGSGQGRQTGQEWNRFQQNWPNIETDPKALTKIYDFMGFVSHLTQLEQQGFNQYKSLPSADLTTWPSKWNTIAQKMGEKYWGTRGREGAR